MSLPRDGGHWLTPIGTESRLLLKEGRASRGPVDTARASVEVSIARDVDAGVAAHLANGTRYRHRIILTPEDGPGRISIDGPELANAWARQIGDVLTRVADLPGVDETDLYLARIFQ